MYACGPQVPTGIYAKRIFFTAGSKLRLGEPSNRRAVLSDRTATGTYTDVRGAWPGAGSSYANPYLVSLRDWGNADDPNTSAEIDGDYHLKSTGARWSTEIRTRTLDDLASPCIDAGDPDSPLGAELQSLTGDPDNERGENLRINLGAYGGTTDASLAVCD